MRRRALIASVVALSLGPSCGFTPLHGEASEGLRGRVALENSRSRVDFAYRERLGRRLGEASGDAEYTLSTEIAIEEIGLAITPDDATTRYDVTGRARYVLRRRGDGAEIAKGEARSATAYSTLASPYATRIAERDARRRVAVDLADRVFTQLAAARLDAG
ncbi:LPS assembly lipoprotein LptE [Rubrimonas cliftonensis]|nr:LPS assembly lipoprotein LptE [Rubrimonas cliftonensis]